MTWQFYDVGTCETRVKTECETTYSQKCETLYDNKCQNIPKQQCKTNYRQVNEHRGGQPFSPWS